MRLDLRVPCKNCPFADTPTRIVFACRERAEEIEESAYRNGFPCHLSAVLDEDDEDNGGYVPGPKTQHCVGVIGMYLNAGYDTFPGIDNREIAADYSAACAVAFENEEAFFGANAQRDSGSRAERHDPQGHGPEDGRAAEGIAQTKAQP